MCTKVSGQLSNKNIFAVSLVCRICVPFRLIRSLLIYHIGMTGTKPKLPAVTTYGRLCFMTWVVILWCHKKIKSLKQAKCVHDNFWFRNSLVMLPEEPCNYTKTRNLLRNLLRRFINATKLSITIYHPLLSKHISAFANKFLSFLSALKLYIACFSPQWPRIHLPFLYYNHNEHGSVSNHQRLHCLLSCRFRCQSKETSKPRVTGLCVGNWPVNSPHKRPVTRKMLHLMT